jgi:L-alanine-DL-glutamate epimerase-like enolase superfamily enzyme
VTTTGTSIDAVTVAVYRFPTDRPEADGTLTWDATTAVTAVVHAGQRQGLGWTYSTTAAARVITDHLAPAITGRDLMDTPACWSAMHRACRNLGTRGLVMQAISAVDIALWDLKARALDVSLPSLFGRARDTVPVYGSGGFTTLTDAQLAAQVNAWVAAGCTAMKIKIGQSFGTDVDRDLARVNTFRDLAGPGVNLMVDANGGYTLGQARRVGATLDRLGVVWFEEPVSSDDITGLAAVRATVHCDVTAGEYAADLYDVARLCPIVDCLQLDVTRCGGYTGWLRGAAVAQAHNLQISAHCAPALHAPVAAAVPNLRHVEWFIDHARLEPLLVDGAPTVQHGALQPNDYEPGHGMTIAAPAAHHRMPPSGHHDFGTPAEPPIGGSP